MADADPVGTGPFLPDPEPDLEIFQWIRIQPLLSNVFLLNTIFLDYFAQSVIYRLNNIYLQCVCMHSSSGKK